MGRYFNIVLDALLDMEDKFIKPPTLETLQQIAENPRWIPYFKVCSTRLDL